MEGSLIITATVEGTATTITIITRDLMTTAAGILGVGIQVGTTAEDILVAVMTAAEAEGAAEMVEEEGAAN